MHTFPTIDTIKEAAARIEPHVHRTPVFTSATIDRLCGRQVYFKCENMQKVGAFKARGAVNAVLSLSDDDFQGNPEKCVTTHSSGNHAAALAYAARRRGIQAHVVMPENAPPAKKEAVAGYGARITYTESTQKAREEALDDIVTQTGAVFIHPYNDPRVVAGQATASMELMEQVPGFDTVIAPVGGGGLLSGTALSVSDLQPKTAIIGAEPEGADDAFRSLQAGKIIPQTNPRTIADGLRTSLGDLTFPIIQKHVSAILTANEDAIVEAMRLVWERMKLVIEPSAALPLAVLMVKGDQIKGEKVGLIVSGGNADLDHLPWLEG